MRARPIFTLIAILSVACVAGSFTNAQQATESDSVTAINKLLAQRRDILAKRVALLEGQYAAGALPLETMLTARDKFLEAELELVTGKEQRLPLYRKRLDNMRRLEDVVKQRCEAGQCSVADTLLATAARLQAEIDLLREQSSNAKSG